MILFRFIFLKFVTYASYNLYDTDRSVATSSLYFDCLHYYVTSENIDLRADNAIIKQVIKYCIRSEDEISTFRLDQVTSSRNFSFDQLRKLNVTVQQLLSWSASIDSVEKYLIYLTQSNVDVSLSNEMFYNCTSPWFGSQCQYSFLTNVEGTFSAIVETKFQRMKKYQEVSGHLPNITCYEHLKCNRGGSHLCLDWREICNGQVDCMNEGVDEAQCFDLEINECNEDEYRCHNGICIPKEFWKDDRMNPDCLDRSDEPEIPSTFDLCFQDLTFRCEEHSCRPGKANFPCGDGQCTLDLEFCQNGRTKLLEEALLAKDNLSDTCWLHLACFALVIPYYNSEICRSVIESLNFNSDSHLASCKKLSQFPTTYAVNGHIRFLYKKNRNVTFIKRYFIYGTETGNFDSVFINYPMHSGSSLLGSSNAWSSLFGSGNTWSSLSSFGNVWSSEAAYILLETLTRICSFNGSSIKYPSIAMVQKAPSRNFFGPECFSYGALDKLMYFRILLPDYICYDEILCDHIRPTVRKNNLTCRHFKQLKIASIKNYTQFIIAIKEFFRGCAITHEIAHNDKFQPHPSLYCCQKSSKCISKHRLLDGIVDCDKGDDEDYEFTCSLNQTSRSRCDDKENRCYSPIITDDICQRNMRNNIHQTYFQNLCNGMDDIFPLEVDGRSDTDETECQYWPCEHIYTKCDNLWACPDGRDEDGCIESGCPLETHPCVLHSNYTLTCLPFDRVNDGIIDCLGASDEPRYCRNKNHSALGMKTFRCQTSKKCVSFSDLCNEIIDCSKRDDESFCQRNIEIDSEEKNIPLHLAEKIIFQTFKEKKDLRQFTLETSPSYPVLLKNTVFQHEEFIGRVFVPTNVTQFDRDDENRSDNFGWEQYCHRGIYVHKWLESENDRYSCFCPPSYYGNTCQYQSERVSLTLRFLPVDRHSIYAVLVKLIDEYDQTNSYEQFTFMAVWGCRMKFNTYLLYSTRPKHITKNYSIRIDAYNKDSLVHNASWYLSIPFAFLPVNRVVAQLVLPVQRSIIPYSCNLTCNNYGQCAKYENTQEFFCHYTGNWTGPRCEIPVNCNDCSPDSICVGSFNHRSVCVCPPNKVGPRCLLPAVCPSNACKNNGRCVLADDNTGTSNYICLCSEEFYGLKCEHIKKRLDIILDNIPLPSHLCIFIIEVSKESQPSSSMMVKKLFHDQNTVSFYFSKPFHMVFAKTADHYYLAMVQQEPRHHISTSINPAQRCQSVEQLINSTIMSLPLIRRLKHYPRLCQNHTDVQCFFDEFYMCICTLEHYPNCFPFNHQTKLTCKQPQYCKNGATCLQDDPSCPSNTICLCADCYFGTQCQFYAKRFWHNTGRYLTLRIAAQSNIFSTENLSQNKHFRHHVNISMRCD